MCSIWKQHRVLTDQQSCCWSGWGWRSLNENNCYPKNNFESFISSTTAQTPYVHQGSWASSGRSTFAVQSKSPSTTSATLVSKWSERTANSTTSVQTEACEPPEGLMGPPARQRWRQSPQWRWPRWTPMSSCTCGPSTTCKLLIGHQGVKYEYMIKFREELPVVNIPNTTSRMKSSFDLKSLFLQTSLDSCCYIC